MVLNSNTRRYTKLKVMLDDDDDFVGFRSLCALGIYGMDH